jgi:hypothetical protein
MKTIFKDTIIWGAGLWFVGWVLGIVAFMMVPANMIGWVVSPIGILATLWVLFAKINPPAGEAGGIMYYLKISVAWTIIAIVLDYLLLVQLFKPADGYYKPDVYFYYFTTFALPLIAWYFKNRKAKANLKPEQN